VSCARVAHLAPLVLLRLGPPKHRSPKLNHDGRELAARASSPRRATHAARRAPDGRGHARDARVSVTRVCAAGAAAFADSVFPFAKIQKRDACRSLRRRTHTHDNYAQRPPQRHLAGPQNEASPSSTSPSMRPPPNPRGGLEGDEHTDAHTKSPVGEEAAHGMCARYGEREREENVARAHHTTCPSISHPARTHTNACILGRRGRPCWGREVSTPGGGVMRSRAASHSVPSLPAFGVCAAAGYGLWASAPAIVEGARGEWVIRRRAHA